MIANGGQTNCEGFGDQGNRLSVTYQIADVMRPLLSVYEMTRAGHIVHFDGHSSYIEDKKMDKKERIAVARDKFIFKMWMHGSDDWEKLMTQWMWM